jgi:hypothetical protein
VILVQLKRSMCAIRLNLVHVAFATFSNKYCLFGPTCHALIVIVKLAVLYSD